MTHENPAVSPALLGAQLFLVELPFRGRCVLGKIEKIRFFFFFFGELSHLFTALRSLPGS